MATATPLTADECQAILLRWKTEGPSDEERDVFVKAALSLFADEDLVASLVDSFGDIAQSAANIDKTFDEVERILWLVVLVIWPVGLVLLQEWTGYKTVGPFSFELWRCSL